MISTGLKISVVALLLGAGAVFAVMLRLDNVRLRKRLAVVERGQREAVQLRSENERARALLAQTETAGADATRAVQHDLERWRSEVAALEKLAVQNAHAQKASAHTDRAALDGNHDPEAGLTRLEQFRDAGQATPSAAFQTFVWAVMTGDEAKQARMIVFAGAGRATAEAIVATLPERDRAKFPGPENLAALFFADAFTQMPAAHVTRVSVTDAQHAVVAVRGLTSREQKIPMQLGPDGWQIAMPEPMARALAGWTRRKLGLATE